MAVEPGPSEAVEAASQRLDRALSLLAERMQRGKTAAAETGGVKDDRARLAAQLDEAAARERSLTEAGRKASAALASAIAEVEAELARG